MHRSAARLRPAAAARHPAVVAGLALAAAFGIAVAVRPAVWGSFTALAVGDRETLRRMLAGAGALAPVGSVLLNVLQAVVAPLPGFVIPYVDGVVFGTLWGMVVTLVGGVAGSASCFWLARGFGRRFAELICSRFTLAEAVNARLERHSFAAILVARLIPGVPFDFLSYFAGMARIRFAPFIVATTLGSLPYAFVSAFAGASLGVPMWLGVLTTPALGLAWTAARRISRRRPGVSAITAREALPAPVAAGT